MTSDADIKQPEGRKRPYQTPQLKRFGPVAVVTRGGTGTVADALLAMKMQGTTL